MTSNTLDAELQKTKRVAVIIEREQYEALMALAKQERRSGRQQLAHIINSYMEAQHGNNQ